MAKHYVPGRLGKVLNQEEKRTTTLSVRVSEGELAQLRILAKNNHMQVAEYLRACALMVSLPPQVPAVNRDKWVELARMASNLTMLRQAAQSGLLSGDNDIILNDLSEIKKELKRLRASLINHPKEEVSE